MFELFRVYKLQTRRPLTVPLAVGFCHFEMASLGRAFPFFFVRFFFAAPFVVHRKTKQRRHKHFLLMVIWRNLFYFQNRVTLQRVARNGRKKERKKIIFYVDAAD